MTNPSLNFATAPAYEVLAAVGKTVLRPGAARPALRSRLLSIHRTLQTYQQHLGHIIFSATKP